MVRLFYATVVLAWLFVLGSASAQAPPGLAAPEITPPRLVSLAGLEWPAGTPAPPSDIELVLTVDATGAVSDVEQAQSFGAEADQALRDAALRLRFEPARRGDSPLPARIRFAFARPAAPAAPPPASPPPPEPAPLSGPATPPAAAPAQESDSSYGARARVEKPQPGAASQVKLRGPELTMIPGTFGEPLRVVASLPGVARSPFGLGFFLVRGASFQNTGFFVDGFAVPLLYHLGAGPAIISSRLVDQLDFYAGGYPVKYGQYTAGVIALRTAPPPADRLQLELEVDLLRASALAIVPLPDGKGSIALAFRRSYYELLLPLITDAVSLSYTDYQLRFDYRFTPRFRFSLFFFGSRDALNAAQSIGAGATTGNASQGLRYAFDQVIVSAEWQATDSLLARWSGTLGPTRVDLTGQSTGDSTLGTKTGATRLGERFELMLNEGPRLMTTLGSEVSVYLYSVTGAVPSLGELPAIPPPSSEGQTLKVSDRLNELVFAPYLEQVFRPGPFEITGGLRANYYRYGDVSSWTLDPRAVVRYELVKGLKLKAASGLFVQPPIPFQLTRGIGNPRLAPGRAWQNSVGVELKLPASLEIDSSVFYNYMWQIARTAGGLEENASGDAVRPLFLADGEGRSYGLELLLRRRVSQGLFGWLSYTLSRSERFLAGGRSIVFAFDQTHVLNVALSYNYRGWTFGARFTLATGRPVNDIRDATGARVVFDSDEDDINPNGTGQRIRLPTYHQLDVRIDRDWKLGPVKGSVYIDVINVYNAQNSEGYQYSYDFSQRGRLPGLPILPTLGVRAVLQ